MKTLPSINLRALEPEDLDLLYLIENDQSLWNIGASNVPYSRYVLHDYIANTTSDIYSDKQLRLIIENDEGEAVGIADLVSFDPRHMRAEIGLVIISRYRNQGYGSAALSQLLKYSVEILHLHQVYCIVASSNEACKSVFQSFGFEASATLHDWLLEEEGYSDAILFTKILL